MLLRATPFPTKVACQFNTISLFGEFIHGAQGNFCLGFISDALLSLLCSKVRLLEENVF
jgi:hypothetical protein